MTWDLKANIKGPQGDTGPKGDTGDVGELGPLTDVTITNYTESVVSLGVLVDTCTLDLTNGTVIIAALTASTNCVFTMPTPFPGKSFVLMLKQYPSTGGQGTAEFPTVRWPYSIPFVVTPFPGKMDLLTFFSDGMCWYGSYTQSHINGDQDLCLTAKPILPNQNSVTYPLLPTMRRVLKGRSTPRR